MIINRKYNTEYINSANSIDIHIKYPYFSKIEIIYNYAERKTSRDNIITDIGDFFHYGYVHLTVALDLKSKVYSKADFRLFEDELYLRASEEYNKMMIDENKYFKQREIKNKKFNQSLIDINEYKSITQIEREKKLNIILNDE